MRSIKRHLGLFAGLVLFLALACFPAWAYSSIAVVPSAAIVLAPAKLLAIAGSIFAILQTVKKVFNFQGKVGTIVAIALNVVLAALGVIVILKPEQLFSLDTLTAVIIAGLVAAGAHGTWRSVSGPPDSSGGQIPPPNVAQKGFSRLAVMPVVLVLSGVLGLIACAGAYKIHPHSIPVGNDQGLFDSRTGDFLADEHAFLQDAEKTRSDYPEYVAKLLDVANQQYALTKQAYLTWRQLQTAAALSEVVAQKQKLEGAVGDFSTAQQAAKKN